MRQKLVMVFALPLCNQWLRLLSKVNVVSQCLCWGNIYLYLVCAFSMK